MLYRIKKYIRHSLNFFLSIKDRLFPVNKGLKQGVSFLVRAKNEEENIVTCIESIIGIADEIILADNNSSDKTPQLAWELSKKYPDIVRFFAYNKELPLVGEPHKQAVLSGSDNTITTFYNCTLEKATFNNVIKWDADFIAIRENLEKLIDIYRIKSRKDKFAVLITGETLFIDLLGNKYKKIDSIYREYRAFSYRHGFKWVNNKNNTCEVGDPYYMSLCFNKYISDLPCFYEIKRCDKDEMASRETLLDQRDYEDDLILKELRKGIVNEMVKKL